MHPACTPKSAKIAHFPTGRKKSDSIADRQAGIQHDRGKRVNVLLCLLSPEDFVNSFSCLPGDLALKKGGDFW